MKVAIITFHAAHNYGAVLQAYALKTYLSESGRDVSVLDYRPLAIRNPYALVPCFDFHVMERRKYRKAWKHFKIALHWLIKGIPSRARRRKVFECFIRRSFNLSSDRYNSAFKSNLDYDLYVFGSDQIWNPRHTDGFDDVFWGNFDVRKGARKISYAASMIEYDLNSAQRAYVKLCLEGNFSHVSVREKQFAQYLSDSFGKKVPVVLDPTLLVERGVWELIGKKPKIKKKYVLIYALEYREDATQMASKIASQIDAIVIEIVTESKWRLRPNQIMPSPEEFVGLFESAEFAIVESFHGTAFSMIFEKPFISLSRGTDYDARQRTLLDEVGLAHCLLPPTSRPDYFKLQYDPIRNKLKMMREFSASYLEQALDR